MRNNKIQQICRIGFVNYNKFPKSNKWNTLLFQTEYFLSKILALTCLMLLDEAQVVCYSLNICVCTVQ